jgi:hypothetical protein
MSIESAIRTPLKTALSTIAANVYNGIPETMTSPSICLIPCTLFGKRFDQWSHNKSQSQSDCDWRCRLLNNAAALDNLEKLMISIISTMPDGYEVGNVNQPQPLEVGAGKYLTADLQVSTYYTN